MKRLFKWTLVSFVLLALAALFVIYNPTVFRGTLENYLASVSGYDIRLDGDLEIELGRFIHLQATDIHVSAPAWSAREELVVVGNLDLSIETNSLFADMVVLELVSIDDLGINLETDAEGDGNWLTSSAGDSENRADSKKPLVIFNNIRINTASLLYKNNKAGLEHHLQIDSVEQKQAADGMLNLVLGGSLNARPVAFEGTIGPYNNLLQGRDVGYSGKGHFGSMEISGSGSIDDLLAPRRPVFNIQLQGSDLDEITGALGLDDLGNGEYYFNLFGTEADGKYRARAEGKIGDFSLDVSAYASDLSQLSSLDMQVYANGPSLGSITRPFGLDHWPDKPFELKGKVVRQDDILHIEGLTLGIGATRLTLDTTLSNFPHFDPSRAKLHIQGDDVAQFRELLGFHGVATGPFELRGSLEVAERDIELLNIDFKTSLGHLNISGTLGNQPRFAGSNLHLRVDGNSAQELMSVFNIDVLPNDAFTLETRFKTKEDGLLIEKGVLVMSKNDRLDIDGFVSYEPGSRGTNINVNLQGPSLAHVMQQLVPDFVLPGLPYALSGQVNVVESGLQLEAVKSQVAGAELGLAGLVMFADQGLGTELDIDFRGDDISGLNAFRALDGALAVFLPGQPYLFGGQLSFASQGWKLDGVSARVGDGILTLDGLVSRQSDLDGSRLSFAVHGPDLHTLLQFQGIDSLPKGAFNAAGQIVFDAGRLVLKGFNFDSDTANVVLDFDSAWPVAKPLDTSFNLQVAGDDIRTVVPSTFAFKPGLAAFSLTAVGGTQNKVLSLEHFDARIGDFHATIKGQQDGNALTDTVTLALQASADNLSRLGELNGTPLPDAPLKLKSNIRGNADRFVLEGLEALLGESDISARLEVALTGPRPDFKLTAQSKHINLQPYLQSSDKASGADQGSPDFLIPETPIPLDILSMADLTIDLEINELKSKTDISRNVVLLASVQDGSGKVSELSLDGKQGHMVSSLSVEPTENGFADLKIDLSANNMVLNLLGQDKEGPVEMPAFDIEFHANGSGRNLHELAGSLNGSFSTGSDGGVLEGVSLGVMDTLIFDEIFGLIMPSSKDADNLNISCHASALTITNGLVETTPAITYTTDKISIVAKGTLDLKTEALRMNFNATPTNALKISAGEIFNPFILIGGTLSEPSVGLDPTKTLLHGGAAVGTAGISVLAKSLYDRVSNSNSLCEEMRAQQQ